MSAKLNSEENLNIAMEAPVNDTDLSNITTAARAEFDLMERLQGRPTNKKTVTVYTDEVLGEKHTELSASLAKAKLAADDDSEWGGLAEEVRQIAKQIDETGITFHLRAVPRIVERKADRDARKQLKLKGSVPEDQRDDYLERYVAHLLADSVERYVDHQTGTEVNELSVSQAEALRDLLPNGEFRKLDIALGDLSLTSKISEAVTTDADF